MKRRIPRGAIIAIVRRDIELEKQTPAWLQEAVAFDHSLRLLPDELPIAHKLLSTLLEGQPGYKLDQKKFDAEVLISNLLDHKNKPTSISFDSGYWTKSRYKQTSAYVLKLVNEMQEQGMIELRKGYFTTEESRRTRIWATETLLDYFPKLSPHVFREPVELVELRDAKGKLKEYRDTGETHRIRAVLERVNEVNAEAHIQYRKFRLVAHLHAIFKERFTMYGRLHTRGYRHYQGFDEDERAEITINGEPVTELDFSGLHPRLLYAKEGIQFDEDPYSLVNENPIARPFLKHVLLFLLNSTDEVSAEAAANYWLFRNPGERGRLQEIGITRARPIIDAFKEAHALISHHFCTGKRTGLRIMNLDAKIALDVVHHFAEQNIPILAVHDSFLVQSRFENQLRKVMNDSYCKHTKGFHCPIK